MGDRFRIHLRWASVFVFAFVFIFRNMNILLRQFQKNVVVYLKDKTLALGDYIFDGNAIVLETKKLFLDTVSFYNFSRVSFQIIRQMWLIPISY